MPSLKKINNRRRWYPCFRESPDTLVIIVEQVGAWAYLAVIVFLSLAVAINYHVVNTKDNLVLHRYGGNSICIFLDDPPFSYIASTLYVPVAFFFCCFALLKHLRVHVRHTHKPKPRLYYASRVFCVIECLGTCIFAQSFGTQPTQSELVHGFAYACFVIGMLASGLSLGWFYWMYQHPQAPARVTRFMVFYLLSFHINAVCFFLVVVNAFGKDGGLIWDVKSSFGEAIFDFTFKFMFATMIVAPVLFFYMSAPYVEELKLKISLDLTNMVPRDNPGDNDPHAQVETVDPSSNNPRTDVVTVV